MIALTIPSTIPITLISCRVSEPNLNIDFVCSIFSQASNLFKLEILYQGVSQISVYTVKLAVRSVKSATATVTSIPLFYVNIYLPFTDSGTSQASFTGTLFTPYSSLIASCSNPFTYSSVNSQEYIYLSEPKLTGISSSYYSSISFKASFSNSRTTLFDTSILQITFS